ncbi:MAG: transglycosylase SLT domain-containing protein [Acidobacteriota bacterium]|nr:transglycosylase SLT domain-containing protein [Acidobacteriota bacterium]
MRISELYLRIAGIAALALLTSACPNANHTASSRPPKQANAPALSSATSPKPPVKAETKQSPSLAPVVAVAPKPTPAPAPVQQQPEVHSDPVTELIAKVEKEYIAGQENQKAGKLDAANENFDRAFDLLMGSSVEMGSDARLQKEYDRVLEGTTGFDLNTTHQAEDSNEQKPEPAPIDEANEVTVPVDPSIKAKAAAEIAATKSDLPLMMTDQVASYISFYSTRGKGTLERALVRSGRYHDMIQRVLKEEGVPQDLMYLAQAESGFHPLALSRAGARGMWQFMGSRAKGYGLRRSYWVDERQDPEKSTRAAARHLKDLYNQFGDWYLAMAAYNSGPGTVQSAVKRTGYADFWELYRRNVLPKETRNYVPIIVAVTIIAKNPEQYGLADLELEKPVAYDAVKINYSVDLRLVAQCVDAPPEMLQDLNPSLLRLTTPKSDEFELHLPQGTTDKYQTAIAAIPPDMRVWWRYHTVAAADTLASIARTYHLTPRAIAQANKMDSGNELEADNKLIIPLAQGRHPGGDTQAYSRRITHYKVRRGDTVQSVADTVGVSPVMVRQWNHLRGESLGTRRVLYVHLPVTPDLSGRAKVSSKPRRAKSVSSRDSTQLRHTVKAGETLFSIASTYNTTVSALKENNGNLGILRPGMILLIR